MATQPGVTRGVTPEEESPDSIAADASSAQGKEQDGFLKGIARVFGRKQAEREFKRGDYGDVSSIPSSSEQQGEAVEAEQLPPLESSFPEPPAFMKPEAPGEDDSTPSEGVPLIEFGPDQPRPASILDPDQSEQVPEPSEPVPPAAPDLSEPVPDPAGPAPDPALAPDSPPVTSPDLSPAPSPDSSEPAPDSSGPHIPDISDEELAALPKGIPPDEIQRDLGLSSAHDLSEPVPDPSDPALPPAPDLSESVPDSSVLPSAPAPTSTPAPAPVPAPVPTPVPAPILTPAPVTPPDTEGGAPAPDVELTDSTVERRAELVSTIDNVKAEILETERKIEERKQFLQEQPPQPVPTLRERTPEVAQGLQYAHQELNAQLAQLDTENKPKLRQDRLDFTQAQQQTFLRQFYAGPHGQAFGTETEARREVGTLMDRRLKLRESELRFDLAQEQMDALEDLQSGVEYLVSRKVIEDFLKQHGTEDNPNPAECPTWKDWENLINFEEACLQEDVDRSPIRPDERSAFLEMRRLQQKYLSGTDQAGVPRRAEDVKRPELDPRFIELIRQYQKFTNILEIYLPDSAVVLIDPIQYSLLQELIQNNSEILGGIDLNKYSALTTATATNENMVILERPINQFRDRVLREAEKDLIKETKDYDAYIAEVTAITEEPPGEPTTAPEDDPELAALEDQLESLRQQLAELEAELAELDAGTTTEKDPAIVEMEEKLKQQEEEQEEEIAALKEQQEEEIATLKEQHEEEMAALKEELEERITTLGEDIAALSAQLDDANARLAEVIDQNEQEVAAAKARSRTWRNRALTVTGVAVGALAAGAAIALGAPVTVPFIISAGFFAAGGGLHLGERSLTRRAEDTSRTEEEQERDRKWADKLNGAKWFSLGGGAGSGVVAVGNLVATKIAAAKAVAAAKASTSAPVTSGGGIASPTGVSEAIHGFAGHGGGFPNMGEAMAAHAKGINVARPDLWSNAANSGWTEFATKNPSFVKALYSQAHAVGNQSAINAFHQAGYDAVANSFSNLGGIANPTRLFGSIPRNFMSLIKWWPPSWPGL